MGCAVAFTYLLREYQAQRPTVFNAVAANAPLVKADTAPFPYAVATAIGKVMVAFGMDESYAPTKGKSFEEFFDNSAFAGSSTSSLQRWARHRDRCVRYRHAKVGSDQHTGLCLGGVTARFAAEFFDLFEELDAFNGGTGKIATPILIQRAGPADGSDGLVLNAETHKFCTESLRHCTLTGYDDSKHQIWMEKDDISQTRALPEVDRFFQQHRGTRVAQCPLPATCGQWTYKWWPWQSHCTNPSRCSYQYRFGDWHLGMSCRPKADAC